MRPIIVVMLLADAAIFIVTVFAVAVRRSSEKRPKPMWSSLAPSLFICGIGSLQILDRHATAPGANLLRFAGPFLVGLAFMALLLRVREKRRIDYQAS